MEKSTIFDGMYEYQEMMGIFIGYVRDLREGEGNSRNGGVGS